MTDSLDEVNIALDQLYDALNRFPAIVSNACEDSGFSSAAPPPELFAVLAACEAFARHGGATPRTGLGFYLHLIQNAQSRLREASQ